MLRKCERCGRSFNPDAFSRHAARCAGDSRRLSPARRSAPARATRGGKTVDVGTKVAAKAPAPVAATVPAEQLLPKLPARLAQVHEVAEPGAVTRSLLVLPARALTEIRDGRKLALDGPFVVVPVVQGVSRRQRVEYRTDCPKSSSTHSHRIRGALQRGYELLGKSSQSSQIYQTLFRTSSGTSHSATLVDLAP